MARQHEIRGRAHSNKGWQRNHRDGRKTAELDLRLAELRGFRSEDKIAKRDKFHAAAETVSMDGGDFQAVRGGESAKDSMKRREHFLDALGSVVGDFRSGGESLGTCALKNHKITFGKSAFQCRIERLHHRNVENVERRAVQCNPRRAMFEPQLNRFVADGHDCRGALTGKATCPEISDAAFRRTLEFLRCSPPTGNSESVPGLHYREPGRVLFPDLQKVLSSPRGWPVTDLERFFAPVSSLPLRAARPGRPD